MNRRINKNNLDQIDLEWVYLEEGDIDDRKRWLLNESRQWRWENGETIRNLSDDEHEQEKKSDSVNGWSDPDSV